MTNREINQMFKKVRQNRIAYNIDENDFNEDGPFSALKGFASSIGSKLKGSSSGGAQSQAPASGGNGGQPTAAGGASSGGNGGSGNNNTGTGKGPIKAPAGAISKKTGKPCGGHYVSSEDDYYIDKSKFVEGKRSEIKEKGKHDRKVARDITNKRLHPDKLSRKELSSRFESPAGKASILRDLAEGTLSTKGISDSQMKSLKKQLFRSRPDIKTYAALSDNLLENLSQVEQRKITSDIFQSISPSKKYEPGSLATAIFASKKLHLGISDYDFVDTALQHGGGSGLIRELSSSGIKIPQDRKAALTQSVAQELYNIEDKNANTVESCLRAIAGIGGKAGGSSDFLKYTAGNLYGGKNTPSGKSTFTSGVRSLIDVPQALSDVGVQFTEPEMNNMFEWLVYRFNDAADNGGDVFSPSDLTKAIDSLTKYQGFKPTVEQCERYEKASSDYIARHNIKSDRQRLQGYTDAVFREASSKKKKGLLSRLFGKHDSVDEMSIEEMKNILEEMKKKYNKG